MSTNYYATVAATGEELHLGKSSAGWVFAVRVYPHLQLNTLYDWIALLAQPGNTVRDEYGRTVELPDLLNTVMNRPDCRQKGRRPGKTPGEGSWEYNSYEFC